MERDEFKLYQKQRERFPIQPIRLGQILWWLGVGVGGFFFGGGWGGEGGVDFVAM